MNRSMGSSPDGWRSTSSLIVTNNVDLVVIDLMIEVFISRISMSYSNELLHCANDMHGSGLGPETIAQIATRVVVVQEMSIFRTTRVRAWMRQSTCIVQFLRRQRSSSSICINTVSTLYQSWDAILYVIEALRLRHTRCQSRSRTSHTSLSRKQ